VNVHPTDDKLPGYLLKIVGKSEVAIVFGCLLVCPVGKWVCRRRDEGTAVFGDDSRKISAKLRDLLSGFGDLGAYPCSYLDLGLEELVCSCLTDHFIYRRPHLWRWTLEEISGLAIDDEVFLFDADGEGGSFHQREPI
jgi:hypothetical protein